MAEESKSIQKSIQLTVEGVHCTSCKAIIEEALQDIGATQINVAINAKTQTGSVACKYNGDMMNVVNAIKKEGYKVRK